MNKTQDPKLQIATDLERERERELGFWPRLRERGPGFRSKRAEFWLRFRERERKLGFRPRLREREPGFRSKRVGFWLRFRERERERKLGFRP